MFYTAFEWLFSVVSTYNFKAYIIILECLLIGIAVHNTHSDKAN